MPTGTPIENESDRLKPRSIRLKDSEAKKLKMVAQKMSVETGKQVVAGRAVAKLIEDFPI